MNKLPPSVLNGLHPDDIIPVDVKPVLFKHYMATYKTKSTEEFNKALEKANISPESRQIVASVYKELQSNGWYPNGIGTNDIGNYDIIWVYRVSRPSRADNLPQKMTPAQAREHLNANLAEIGISF